MQRFLNQPRHIYDEKFYSEPFNCNIFRLLIHSKPQHIQNSRHSRYRVSLKYSLLRTECNLGIFTTLAYLSPSVMRTRRILKTLSNMYDGVFSIEPYITLAYSELQAYSEPCRVSVMENFIQSMELVSWNLVLQLQVQSHVQLQHI